MLELRGVGFRYPGGDWVLRDLTLSVPAGSATVVLGPNGRGKTTLVRIAAGLLKQTEGSVRRSQRVGYVPQAHGSAFAYSVLEMVLMGRASQVGTFSVPGRRDVAAAEDALERVGISQLANRAFPLLSGGEQQLVLIARAVASQSGILVLDEPATALDLRHQGLVLALLRSLIEDGMAVLMTTHHPDQALYLGGSAVLLLGPGQSRSGSIDELLTDDQLTTLYGVKVRSVTYTEGGDTARVLVPGYESTTAQPLSRAPAWHRSDRPRR